MDATSLGAARHAAKPHSRKAQRTGALSWWGYAVPIAIPALLVVIYLVSPSFYLRYVLAESRREYQAVEVVTVLSALTGSVLTFLAGWRLWKSGRRLEPANRRGVGFGMLLILLVALAAFFFAGEEVSWGQTWLGWSTPEGYRETVSPETNLHNSDFRVQSLGSLFLIVMFFVLPGVWAFREKLKLPVGWVVAVADGHIVFGMAVAFLWKFFKDIYRIGYSEPSLLTRPFYHDFIEQINEQKEMLVGVALLMYGLSRVTAVRRYLAGRADHPIN